MLLRLIRIVHTHEQPMLSLEKIQASDSPTKDEEPDRERRNRLQDERTIEEFRAFDATIRKQLGKERVSYILEPKVDGVSLSAHYRAGKLALGATRGDGREGDDITTNLRTVRSVPLQLNAAQPPGHLEVRGEAYMATKEFNALNAKLAAAGEEFASIRSNLTAQLDTLEQTTGWMLRTGATDPNAVLSGSSPYQRMWGIVLGPATGKLLAAQMLLNNFQDG